MKCNIHPATQNPVAMADVASQVIEDGVFPTLVEVYFFLHLSETFHFKLVINCSSDAEKLQCSSAQSTPSFSNCLLRDDVKASSML